MSWKEIDSLVHAEIISSIIATGRAPRSLELASKLNRSTPEIVESLARLEENHGLLLHPQTSKVWIVHPFSLSPTATWVQSDSRGWWAPCLWCAFGIATLVRKNCTVHSRIGGELERVAFSIADGKLQESSLVALFPIPPREAWKNVHHFCARLLPFKKREDVEAWCKRYDFPLGEVVPVHQLFDLARIWYGRHQQNDWVKWSLNEANEIFQRAGLKGDFWDLHSKEERF